MDDITNSVPKALKTSNSSSSPKPLEVPTFKSSKLGTSKFFVGGIFAGLLLVITTFFFLQKSNSDILRPLADLTGDDAADTSSTVEVLQNPITGELTPITEATDWADTRPLATMVNNYIDARPQSGLINADLTYEVVAEGGITRFIAFFLSNTPEKIGPIRSTRHYYLVLVKELGDAMLMHIGWSPQALEAIETWPVRSLGRGGGSFWRDQTRLANGIATEHTAYVNGIELREVGDNLGWTGASPNFVTWQFKEDAPSATPQTNPIQIHFWFEGDYSAIWRYDNATNSYLRFMGYNAQGDPIAHIDQETKEQISIKNLIVQFAVESPIIGDNKNRLDYELVGSGDGLVFLDGNVINATWNKVDRDSRTLWFNQDGQEIMFNRGKFWISIVPTRNSDQITY